MKRAAQTPAPKKPAIPRDCERTTDGPDETLYDPRIVLDGDPHHSGRTGRSVRGLCREPARRRSFQAGLCRDQPKIDNPDTGTPGRYVAHRNPGHRLLARAEPSPRQALA